MWSFPRAAGLIAALAAVFAVMTPVAGAANFTWFNTSTSSHVAGAVFGDEVEAHKITAGTGVGTITCSTVDFAGSTATGQESPLTITPEYSGCHVVILGVTYETHVSMNGCDYRWNFVGGSEQDTFEGSMDILCPKEKSIDIKITKSGSFETKCTVTIGSQNGLRDVVYHNDTAFGDMRVTFEVDNLTNTTSGGALGCGIGDGVHTNGTYVGTSTLRGYSVLGTQVDFTAM